MYNCRKLASLMQKCNKLICMMRDYPLPPLNPTTFLCFSNLFVLAVSLRGLLFPLYEK